MAPDISSPRKNPIIIGERGNRTTYRAPATRDRGPEPTVIDNSIPKGMNPMAITTGTRITKNLMQGFIG